LSYNIRRLFSYLVLYIKMNLYASIPTFLRLLVIDYMFKCPFCKRVIPSSRLFLYCDIDARFVFYKINHSSDYLLIKLVRGSQVESADIFFVNLWVVLPICFPDNLNLLFASQSINKIEMGHSTCREVAKYNAHNG
jgi:hypothetical protein